MQSDHKISPSTIQLIINIVILIIGIILIAVPNVAISLITIILGVVLLVFGIIQLMVTVKKDLGKALMVMPIVSIVVGVVFIIFSETIANTILPFVIGLWILVMGIMGLVEASGNQMRSTWKASIVISIICIAIGIILLIGVFAGQNILSTLLGVCMVIYGVISLVNWLMARAHKSSKPTRVQ